MAVTLTSHVDIGVPVVRKRKKCKIVFELAWRNDNRLEISH